MRALLSCLILVAALSVPSLASANARHERTNSTAVKSGGKVTGAKIAVILPASGRHDHVRIVVGTPAAGANRNNYRGLRNGSTPGYVQHATPLRAATGITPFEFTLTYGQGNTLRSGDVIDVMSLWETVPALEATQHVWGMTREGVPPEQYTLP